MHFDFTDTQLQTFLLRMLHSLFILAVSIELYRSALVVDNERLTRIFWKAALLSVLFFGGRITAGVLDSVFAFAIGWFSNLVNVGFWLYLVYKTHTVRVVLSSPKNNEVRVSLREDFDVILDKLHTAKENAQKLR